MSNQFWAGFAGLTGINDISNEEAYKNLSQNQEFPVENSCGLDVEATISMAREEVVSDTTRTLQIDDEIINLNIPAGIENGQRLRLRGKGNTESATGRRGDLYVIIELTGTPSLDQQKATELIGTDDPWFSNSTEKPSILNSIAEAIPRKNQNSSHQEYNFIYENNFSDGKSEEVFEVEYQRANSKSADKGKLLGTYKAQNLETTEEAEWAVKIYAKDTLDRVDYNKRIGENLEPGQRIMTIFAEKDNEITSLIRYERVKRIQENICIQKYPESELGFKPTRFEFCRWEVMQGEQVTANTYLCSILAYGIDKIARINLVANTTIVLSKCLTDIRSGLDICQVLGIAIGELTSDMESLYAFDIDKDPTLVICNTLEEGTSHWSIDEWHCSPGSIAESSSICSITEYSYEREIDTLKTLNSHLLYASQDLTISEILAEEGVVLEIGDPLIRIKEKLLKPVHELLSWQQILNESDDSCVTFAPLYDENTHCTVLTISDTLINGSVKESEEIMRLECYEDHDNSKVRCIAKLIALMDINNINLLVEKGSVLNPGDKIISAPILKSITTPDAIKVDLNDGFVRFAPLFDGNSHSQVLSISDALARRSIKTGGELMKLECYGDHDHSEIRFIGTLIALIDLEGINLEVKEGASLEPGDKIFFAPIFEKMQVLDAIRVDVNAFTAERQKSLDTEISYFREAKSFDTTMILSRLHQDKKLQLQNLREVSNKRNASISAGTALASVAATATGFAAVASILSLLRMAYQSSHKNGEVDNDLEQGTQTAEEIRQLLTNQRSRLGEAQGRFIGIDRDNHIRMYSVTQSASRGLHIIELNYAGNTDYLESGALRNCLANSFNDEELAEIWGMLLPISTQAIKGIRLISSKEALDNDQFYQILSGVGSAYRVELENSNRLYVYKLPIPYHSDF